MCPLLYRRRRTAYRVRVSGEPVARITDSRGYELRARPDAEFEVPGDRLTALRAFALVRDLVRQLGGKILRPRLNGKLRTALTVKVECERAVIAAGRPVKDPTSHASASLSHLLTKVKTSLYRERPVAVRRLTV